MCSGYSNKGLHLLNLATNSFREWEKGEGKEQMNTRCCMWETTKSMCFDQATQPQRGGRGWTERTHTNIFLFFKKKKKFVVVVWCDHWCVIFVFFF
eukprot:m.38527 g.38527  ORF g.38527 m.38527 type:complete len:96 (-) comp13815_c0_seq1:30-317(-)